MSTPITPPGPDVTPPVVSSPAPSGTLPVGTTQATLGVATNEPATCRYGSSPGVAFDTMPTVFTTTGGTAHSSAVGPLTDGGSYTYYVRCRDGAGNVTTSDVVVTFAVAAPPPPDTTPPTVAVTAPAAGATVSGAPHLTATATDAVGVAGVQFLLDGAPVGAEDTTSPYSVSWNTTTAANGPHTLTARARDGAGNTTTSAVVAVTVSQPASTRRSRCLWLQRDRGDRGGGPVVQRQQRHRHVRDLGRWPVRERSRSQRHLDSRAGGQQRGAQRAVHDRGLGAQPGQRRLRDDRHRRDEPGPLPRQRSDQFLHRAAGSALRGGAGCRGLDPRGADVRQRRAAGLRQRRTARTGPNGDAGQRHRGAADRSVDAVRHPELGLLVRHARRGAGLRSRADGGRDPDRHVDADHACPVRT